MGKIKPVRMQIFHTMKFFLLHSSTPLLGNKILDSPFNHKGRLHVHFNKFYYRELCCWPTENLREKDAQTKRTAKKEKRKSRGELSILLSVMVCSRQSQRNNQNSYQLDWLKNENNVDLCWILTNCLKILMSFCILVGAISLSRVNG